MTKPTAELRNWTEAHDPVHKDLVLEGEVFNDEKNRFTDGRRIRTSPVLDRELFQEPDNNVRWYYLYYTKYSTYKCYLKTKLVE